MLLERYGRFIHTGFEVGDIVLQCAYRLLLFGRLKLRCGGLCSRIGGGGLSLLHRLISTAQLFLQCLNLLLRRGQPVFQLLNVSGGDRRLRRHRGFGCVLFLWRRRLG